MEYKVFQQLLGMVPHLNERLAAGSEEECMIMADLVRLVDECRTCGSYVEDSKRYI
jgi:hypothetical protein